MSYLSKTFQRIRRIKERYSVLNAVILITVACGLIAYYLFSITADWDVADSIPVTQLPHKVTEMVRLHVQENNIEESKELTKEITIEEQYQQKIEASLQVVQDLTEEITIEEQYQQEIEASLQVVRTRFGLHQDPSNFRKKNIVLIAPWRSGSSFAQDVITSHPHVLKIYEPLIVYKKIFLKKLRNWNEVVPDAKEFILDLMHCRFSRNTSALLIKKPIVFENFGTVMNYCSRSIYSRQMCYAKQHLEPLCQMHPVSLMKLVRLPVELMQPFMSIESLDNLQLLLLMRDPRAIMNSRQKEKWCYDHRECIYPSITCSDMKNDLESALEMQNMYPDRVHILRYEDIALSPQKMTNSIFNALDLEVTDSVIQYLKVHTNTSVASSKYFRDSKKRVMGWANEMSWEDIVRVQDDCSEYMKLAGYVPATQGNFTVDEVFAEVSFVLK